MRNIVYHWPRTAVSVWEACHVEKNALLLHLTSFYDLPQWPRSTSSRQPPLIGQVLLRSSQVCRHDLTQSCHPQSSTTAWPQFSLQIACWSVISVNQRLPAKGPGLAGERKKRNEKNCTQEEDEEEEAQPGSKSHYNQLSAEKGTAKTKRTWTCRRRSERFVPGGHFWNLATPFLLLFKSSLFVAGASILCCSFSPDTPLSDKAKERKKISKRLSSTWTDTF